MRNFCSTKTKFNLKNGCTLCNMEKTKLQNLIKKNLKIALNQKKTNYLEAAVILQIATLKNHKTVSSKIVKFYAC